MDENVSKQLFIGGIFSKPECLLILL